MGLQITATVEATYNFKISIFTFVLLQLQGIRSRRKIKYVYCILKKRRFLIHIGFERNTLIGSVQTPNIILCS